MKHYTEVKAHVDKLTDITCDRCSLKVSVEDIEEINNFHSMKFRGSYGSNLIGDLNTVEVDLCESCLDGCLGAYWRRINVDELEGLNY